MLSRAAVAVCLAIGLGSIALGDIVPIDYPGAASTYVAGINDLGQVIGSYIPSSCTPGTACGGQFLYSNGVFSPLNLSFIASGINDSGEIVGGDGTQVILDNNGAVSVIPIPGASSAGAIGINNRGDIVGEYFVESSNFFYSYSFMYSGGVVTTLSGSPVSTAARGINDLGQVVVDLQAGSAVWSGGIFSPINVPGYALTLASGINDQGEIVGSYYLPTNVYGAFSDVGGIYSTFGVPGAVSTYAVGVNNSGWVLGDDADANGNYHGFLDTPVPEPSSIVLLASATGLLAFAGLRRKRRAANRF